MPLNSFSSVADNQNFNLYNSIMKSVFVSAPRCNEPRELPKKQEHTNLPSGDWGLHHDAAGLPALQTKVRVFFLLQLRMEGCCFHLPLLVCAW